MNNFPVQYIKTQEIYNFHFEFLCQRYFMKIINFLSFYVLYRKIIHKSKYMYRMNHYICIYSNFIIDIMIIYIFINNKS